MAKYHGLVHAFSRALERSAIDHKVIFEMGSVVLARQVKPYGAGRCILDHQLKDPQSELTQTSLISGNRVFHLYIRSPLRKQRVLRQKKSELLLPSFVLLPSFFLRLLLPSSFILYHPSSVLLPPSKEEGRRKTEEGGRPKDGGRRTKEEGRRKTASSLQSSLFPTYVCSCSFTAMPALPAPAASCCG